MDGIDGIKTPYNHVKTEISASKNIFHSFHAILWSMDHTQKRHSNAFRSSFKTTKESLLVTFSTIFFLLFHLAIGRQSCTKNLGKIVKLVFKIRSTQNASML